MLEQGNFGGQGGQPQKMARPNWGQSGGQGYSQPQYGQGQYAVPGNGGKVNSPWDQQKAGYAQPKQQYSAPTPGQFLSPAGGGGNSPWEGQNAKQVNPYNVIGGFPKGGPNGDPEQLGQPGVGGKAAYDPRLEDPNWGNDQALGSVMSRPWGNFSGL